MPQILIKEKANIKNIHDILHNHTYLIDWKYHKYYTIYTIHENIDIYIQELYSEYRANLIINADDDVLTQWNGFNIKPILAQYLFNKKLANNKKLRIEYQIYNDL